MFRVLVTGANGFVGGALLRHLRALGYSATGICRNEDHLGSDLLKADPLGPDADWRKLLKGIDIVVHSAARTHLLYDKAIDPVAEFRRVNVEGTLALAAQSLEMGVRRFVFISSIHVNGSCSGTVPFTESQEPKPASAYAISKLEAEQGLWRLVSGRGMEVVIIRPSLVYAANAPANFARLLRLVKSGVPLPLAAVNNWRSLLALENLLDFIVLCLDHPAAADQLFLVADGESVSTPELIRCLAEGMQRPPRLWPCSEVVLKFGAKVSGRESMYQQLCGNLQIDISKARSLLGWSPPFEACQSLRQAGQSYLQRQHKTTGH